MGEIDTAIAVSLGLLPHGARPFSHTVAPYFAAPAAVAKVDAGAVEQGGAVAISQVGAAGQGGAADISRVGSAEQGSVAGAFERGGEVSG